MNEKCRLCGSYQFNLHQESIDQGELCDVHYWKVLALKGRDVAKFINGITTWRCSVEELQGNQYR
jgi:folate-binding Fe-S cluster repair protein YgfZ